MPKKVKAQLMTEVAVARIQPSSNERTTTYTTGSDFCRIFKEDMQSLYTLSLMLTADPLKAEQLFAASLDDCTNGNPVFREWARPWTRRVIIKNAVQQITPMPAYDNGTLQAAVAGDTTNQNLPELPAEISALL